MARIRTIKPEFWTDEVVASVSIPARLLFICTWNVADDHGGLDRSAHQLKVQAFPYDTLDCESLIQELLHAGLLVEYQSGRKKYLHIPGFRKHQRNERPAAPRVPLYDGATVASNGATVHMDGATVPCVCATDVGVGATVPSHGSYLLIKDDYGREPPSLRDGTLAPCARSPTISEASQLKTGVSQPTAEACQPKTGSDLPTIEASQPKAKARVPFPDDFALSDAMREQALKRYPDCDVERWFELFRAHHQAHGKLMKSWCSAWVTWVGNGEQYGYPRKLEGVRAQQGLPIINA